MSPGRSDVYVARQICEEVDDTPYCAPDRTGGPDPHTLCLSLPRVASWPDPDAWNDLDTDEPWPNDGQ